MPQIREQIAMVHLPPSKTLKYLFHVRKTKKKDDLYGRLSFLHGNSTIRTPSSPPQGGVDMLCAR